ncbi:MAG: benzodiazapine receptor [Myxococcota bacterium]
MTQRTRLLWAVLNTAGLAVALVCNGLANALPLNGMDTGALSDLYPNLFVPMGLTFSIWAVIYLWLLVLVGYGFTQIRSERARNPLTLIGPWFLVNTLANAAWIFAWHWQQVVLALGIMGVILVSLIAMYLRLGVGSQPASATDRWLVHAPISIYMGWITVATIANVTTLAVDLGAPAFGSVPAALTAGVMATAVLIAGRMLWSRRDILYALVVVWAFVGIYLKRSGATEDGSGLVANAALIGLVVLGVGVLAAAAVKLKNGAAPAA